MPVEGVIVPPKITVPPGANIAEPGVFKSMHGIVRLVDLRVRFGVDEEDYAKPGKVIIVEVEGGHAGFWVDEIEDVVSFPVSGWGQVPAYIPKNVFSRTLIEKENIRLYADFEQLDKFKTSGYLRKHIEMIKAEEKKASEIKNKSVEVVETKSAKIFEPIKEANEAKSERVDIENSVSKETLAVEEKNSVNEKISYSAPISEVKSGKYNVGKNKKEGYKKASVVSPVNDRGVDHKLSPDGVSTIERSGVDRTEVVRKKSYPSSNDISVKTESNKDPKENKVSLFEKEESKSGGLVLFGGFAAIFVLITIYFLIDFIEVDKKYNAETGYIHKGAAGVDKSVEIDRSPGELKEVDNSPVDILSETKNKLKITEGVSEDSFIERESVSGALESGAVEISKSEQGVLIVINDYDASDEGEEEEGIGGGVDESSGVLTEPPSDDSPNVIEEVDLVGVGLQESSLVKEVKHEVPIESSEEIKESEGLGRNDESKNEIALADSSEQVDLKTLKNRQLDMIPNVPASKKYIHVVVKGDTLWHIAKRYVDNPWRYPELARLSHIKNPDLIYPGNQVVIVINYKKNNIGK